MKMPVCCLLIGWREKAQTAKSRSPKVLEDVLFHLASWHVNRKDGEAKNRKGKQEQHWIDTNRAHPTDFPLLEQYFLCGLFWETLLATQPVNKP
jgi:hypothetical protein